MSFIPSALWARRILMGPGKIFGQGLRITIQKRRLIAYLWTITFFFSLVVVAPFYFLFQSHLSRSLLGENFFAGADLLWTGDLIYKYQEMPPLVIGWIGGTSLLFLVLSIFLKGGIIGRIAAGEEKVTFQSFFGDCGRYFGRFFRVFLISIIGYFLVLGLFGRFLSIPFRLWSKRASTEWTTLISSALRLLVLLLIFSIVKMFFDYVRVSLVSEDSRRAVRATVGNFRFLRRRFFKAWALFLAVGLIFVLSTCVYLIGMKSLPKAGLGPVIVFVWQQAYFLMRLWTGILLFATEYQFLTVHRPPTSSRVNSDSGPPWTGQGK